jgi:hypothetical protein
MLVVLTLIPNDTASADPVGRDAAFTAAAREYGVPERLLEAVSYSQTRWDAHAGEHNTDGGYGPMNLIDGTLFAGDLGAGSKDDETDVDPFGPAAGSLDSLGKAADLLGVEREQLRNDPTVNIRGGAALLADKQQSLDLPVGAGTDPGQWYAAVAAIGGSNREAAARRFADDVYAALAEGATRTTEDGERVTMAATAVQPRTGQLAKLDLIAAKQSDPNIECPRGLGCEWIPAPYQELGGGDYGNHDKAVRNTPAGPSVDYIVLHDTETDYQTTLDLVTDPTYLSWHYTMRSVDGHIAQNMHTWDVGWHAGNWYVNAHSIGIEQEGYAAEGATWYTESLYRNSARLVRYLAKKYDVPLDPAHIIGHDEVPGVYHEMVAGMHWDPGPYWDWEHYFQLLGRPLEATRGRPSSQIVRILPGFDGNEQPVTGCTTAGEPCEAQGTNFVYLHTEPSFDAPLVRDVGLHTDGSASTTEVWDIGARAMAGQEYAVAERQGDWTAIWYLGQKAWLHNPLGDRTAKPVGGWLVVPKQGVEEVITYGRAYPEPEAYPAHIPVQAIRSLNYRINAGQSAVLTDATVPTDYYRAVTYDAPPPQDHVVVSGKIKYYQVSIGHRIAYVRADQVDVVRAR